MRFPEYLQTTEGVSVGVAILSEWTRTRENTLDWILLPLPPTMDGLTYLINKHVPKEHRSGAFDEMGERIEVWRISWQDNYHRLIKQLAAMPDYRCEHCGYVLSVVWEEDVESLAIKCNHCEHVGQEVGE